MEGKKARAAWGWKLLHALSSLLQRNLRAPRAGRVTNVSAPHSCARKWLPTPALWSPLELSDVTSDLVCKSPPLQKGEADMIGGFLSKLFVVAYKVSTVLIAVRKAASLHCQHRAVLSHRKPHTARFFSFAFFLFFFEIFPTPIGDCASGLCFILANLRFRVG